MFQFFCIETANQNRVVLLKEKYNVLECFESLHLLIIYIERVIPMNFMCINSDQTEKKAYKPTRCVKMQNLALAYILHKVWMMNYKVRMLNAITTLLISLIQKGMPESRLFSAV